MKLLHFFLIAVIFIAFSCNNKQNQTETNQKEQVEFKYNTLDFSKGVMTPEILWSFGRIGETELSPDNSKVLFTLTHYSIEQNKSRRDIHLINLSDNSTSQITNTDNGEYSPFWRPDGKKIAFLATDENSIVQIWEINPDGSGLQQVTKEDASISNFLYSPALDKILYTKDVKISKSASDIYPDLPLAEARIIDDLMFRHWDGWEDGYYSHIFVSDYDAEKSSVSDGTDIMPDEPYDTPTKPFGGVEEITFSPDGKKIAYTCKKMTGIKFATSTNSDIYIYDIEKSITTNISDGNYGFDKCPVFSEKSDKIAWESMERDGYEADKIRLFVYDFNTKEITDFSTEFDNNVHQLTWAEDDNKIYFISATNATNQLFSIDLTTKEIKQITEGIHDYTAYKIADNFAIANRMSMSSPVEIFKIDLKTGEQNQITFVNKEILDKIKLGKVEERWMTTTDNKKMHSWIIYPPDFDPNKTYPALLYCQGGPQSTVSQFFSYRWNFQMMAANGYIVVAPNRRGVPGFGQEWNEQISLDYGGQNMKDYLTAIDEMAKEPYIDENRLGAVGASYGGFSIYWLAGNHNKRFKAFIAHDGMFNFISMFGTTEELWFPLWDIGGTYWQPNDKNCYNASPHLYVKNWDTPILIFQGGKDFRVTESQAFEAYTAAKMLGIDARLVHFENENHWVLKPQNGILWQREFYGWLDKYLK